MSFFQILIIEDDTAIRIGVCDALESAGYAVTGVDSGERGMTEIQSSAFDLVLLDVILPGQDGMQILAQIRELSPSLPVIMITARGDVQDRVRGLDLGADDYVVKPFNVRELLARVEAVLRRIPQKGDNPEQFELPGGHRVDFGRRQVCFADGRDVELSEKEADLLRYLASRRGRTITRDELIERIWGINPKGMQTRTVDMHVARLREKIGDDASQPRLILTVRGRGYCLASAGGRNVKRTIITYIGLFVIMVAAMIGITVRMLALERNEQRLALSAESERLALWRMESQLLPLVLEESTCDYNELAEYGADSDSVAPYARCYFRSDSMGGTELLWTHATTPEDLQSGGILKLAELVERDVRDPIFFNTLGESISNEGALLAGNTNAPGTHLANQEPLGNTMQQMQRSESEFRSRANNNFPADAQFMNQALRLSGGELWGTSETNPMTAFWIDNRLYLARHVGSSSLQQAEGCLLDWNVLKPTLIDSIRDLFPEADLVPLDPDEPGDHETLANLPIRLIPGTPVLSNLPVSSALKPTLIVAWSCFLLSAVAIGGLLFGVVRLSERRAAFVSAVTHELRTPLTTFRLYSDLLSDRESISPEKYDGYIETLKNESERLEYLIENVLSWSRLEQSAETQVIENLAWNEFFERIESSLRDRATLAGMTLDTADAVDESSLRFRGNRTAVERILFNLIDNSCKYAKQSEDKRIHIDLQQIEDSVSIRIRDHGPGIPRELQTRLFQPFSKSAEEAARSAPGIGLGLSLSRRLARDMQGRLNLVESSSGGVTFELQLPQSG